MPIPLRARVGTDEGREIGVRVDVALGEAVDLGSTHVALAEAHAGVGGGSPAHLGGNHSAVWPLFCQLLVAGGERSGGGGRGDAMALGCTRSAVDHTCNLNGAAAHRVEPVEEGPLVEKIRLPPAAGEVRIEDGVAPVDIVPDIP